jgi:hypothetical protein
MQVFNKIWQSWKRLGQFIGDLIARIVLTFFYFTIFAPFGIGVRILADPLDIKRTQKFSWIPRTTSDRKLSDSRRMS